MHVLSVLIFVIMFTLSHPSFEMSVCIKLSCISHVVHGSEKCIFQYYSVKIFLIQYSISSHLK